MQQAGPAPIDLAHLNRYTGGEAAVNEEILRLFRQQMAELLDRMRAAAAKGENWFEAAHSLKGSARGVGAFAFANLVAEAEKLQPQDGPALASALSALDAEAERLRDFLATQLR